MKMRELWIKKVMGEGDDLAFFAEDVKSMAPAWYLHGIVPLGPVEEDGGSSSYFACIWGEGDFTSNLEQLPIGICFCEESLTPEEMSKVLEAAALQACHIALLPENFVKWGELLLNMHPECRERDTEMEAFIAAALQERKDQFTDEDYEEF